MPPPNHHRDTATHQAHWPTPLIDRHLADSGM
jgi:hypothetical protein